MLLPNALRAALRRLLREPGFGAAVVLVLALGIGVNSAVFSLVDALLFRGLPIADAERVVRLARSKDPGPSMGSGASYPQLQEDRGAAREAGIFTDLAAFAAGNTVDVGRGDREPVQASATVVSGNYFPLLGVRPQLGRLLTEADDHAAGADTVAVLADGFWRRQFGADPAVVGRRLRVNATEFVVVGVAPPGFYGVAYEDLADLFLPLSMATTASPSLAQFKPFERRGFTWLETVGRLAPGRRVREAQAFFDARTKRLLAVSTAPAERNAFPWVRLASVTGATLGAERRTQVDRASYLLLGVAGLVLAIACAVAAGLLLVRGERRQRELAVRRALGASRLRVVQESLWESALLAGAAGVLGIALAAAGLRAFAATAPAEFPLPVAAATPLGDWRVVAFTAAVALLATLLAGAAPAWRNTRAALAPTIKGAAPGTVGTRTRVTLRDGFVVVQVALSALLLVGAGLLLRTLAKAGAVDLGFDVDHGVAVRLDVGRQGYDRAAGTAFYDALLARVRALPGVTGAALAVHVPVSTAVWRNSIELTHHAATSEEDVSFTPVSRGFFATLGVPLLAGRDFEAADDTGPPVVIVNRAFAERYWPGRDPLGERLTNFGDDGAAVVGVVETVRNLSVREPGEPFLYVPQGQFYAGARTLVARTNGDPEALLRAVRATITAADPHLPQVGPATLRTRVGRALGEERALASLLSAFGLLALALASFGLYAVVAYATELRRREFGVRLALGARGGAVLGAVLRRGLALALVGTGLGLLAAVAAARALGSLLFGVAPVDGPTYAGIAFVLALAAAVASALPAWRAARLDPMAVLRES